MAAERPPINSYFADARIDKRPPINSYFQEEENQAPREPSIYRKGGIYEQFGPTPPSFEPGPRAMAGFVQTGADQPGTALPFIGQVAGGEAGPVGGVAGAVAGEGVRQGIGRLFGVQDKSSAKQFKRAGENAVFGEALGYGTGKAIEKGAEMLGPNAEKAAIRVAKNIIRPTGRLAKRSDVLAKAALEEGVLSSSPQGMISKIKAKSSALQDEIDSIVENYKGGTVNAEGAFKRMDALARKLKSLGKPEEAAVVLKAKDDIIAGGNFRQPVFGEREIADQFVMRGPERPSTSVQKEYKNIPLAGKKKAGILGALKAGEVPDKIIEKKVTNFSGNESVIEDPASVRIIPKGNKQYELQAPEVKRDFLPEAKGPTKKETVQIGTKPKEMTLAEANKRKREEYRWLESKRSGGGWAADTSTPKIAASQEFAGGLRREIARKLPEVDTLNKRFGNMIDLGKATEGRANVGTRNDIMSLGDIILAGNPKSWPLLIAKKLWQGSKGAAAKTLFGLPSTGAKIGGTIKSPAVRALLSNLYDYSRN